MTDLQTLLSAFRKIGIEASASAHPDGTDVVLETDQGDDGMHAKFEFDEDGKYMACAIWRQKGKL